MKCSNCNKEILDASKFCNFCGSKIEVQGKTCPKPECGRTSLPPEALFCPDCVTELKNNQVDSNDFSGDSGTFIDKRDDHKYKWIRIGSQIWMAENLAYKIDDGCWIYEDECRNLLKYGLLYNWKSAIKACPKGWHLPSLDECQELANFLIEVGYYYDEVESIAKALASISEWEESDEQGTPGNKPEENNFSGFNAKPGGGYDFENEEYDGNRMYGGWWTSTEEDEDEAYFIILAYNEDCPDNDSEDKELGFSVRCIKD